MSQHPDVFIIGGGVIGLTTAYFLARDGVSVEVVDKGDFGQEASWAGAGIVMGPGSAVGGRRAYDELRAQSAALHPTLSADLRERTGIDNGYLRCGGLEFINREPEGVLQKWRNQGIAFERLDQKKLHELEPALAPESNAAYHMPDVAQLRNPRHIKALLAACRSFGVALRACCPALGFEHHGQQVTAINTDRGQLVAEKFLLTTGAWTDALSQQIGWRPGIRPIRGQIALLNTEAPVFRRILLCGARYLVPRPDGRVLVGSTKEDVGFEKHTTARAIADLLAFACGLVPALADAPIERCWAGLRPGSPDGMPFLGQVPGFDNLFVAAGHFRSGLQNSPATGMVMKELLLGQQLSLSLQAFRPERLSAASTHSSFQA
jgi:glycine oxidase